MLGDYSTGRDNNFNLLRCLAAMAVLISHAYPIALGAGTPEPLSASVGKSLGSLSVMMFFATSGFLITASFERSDRTSFVMARVLRIFPGLIVCLALVAFVLGPWVSTWQTSDYFESPEPYLFFVRNTLLLFNVYTLPGVLDGQPYPAIVGSIWTLKHEFLCYFGVFLAGVLGLWTSKARAGLTLSVYCLLWYLSAEMVTVSGLLTQLHALSMTFAIGIAFHIWRAHIPLSGWGILASCGLAALTRDTIWYHATLSLAIAYTTFWLAYIPAGILRAYNRLGDYSYGIYIYAFPVQGLVVWAFGSQTALENMLYATPPTLALAILSWHLVEQPSLRARKAVTLRVNYRLPHGLRAPQ